MCCIATLTSSNLGEAPVESQLPNTIMRSTPFSFEILRPFQGARLCQTVSKVERPRTTIAKQKRHRRGCPIRRVDASAGLARFLAILRRVSTSGSTRSLRSIGLTDVHKILGNTVDHWWTANREHYPTSPLANHHNRTGAGSNAFRLIDGGQTLYHAI